MPYSFQYAVRPAASATGGVAARPRLPHLFTMNRVSSRSPSANAAVLHRGRTPPRQPREPATPTPNVRDSSTIVVPSNSSRPPQGRVRRRRPHRHRRGTRPLAAARLYPHDSAVAASAATRQVLPCGRADNRCPVTQPLLRRRSRSLDPALRTPPTCGTPAIRGAGSRSGPRRRAPPPRTAGWSTVRCRNRPP